MIEKKCENCKWGTEDGKCLDKSGQDCFPNDLWEPKINCDTCKYSYPLNCDDCFSPDYKNWELAEIEPKKGCFNCYYSGMCDDCKKYSMWKPKTGKIPPGKIRIIEAIDRDPKSRYYDHGGIETLDIIKAKLTQEQYKGFLLGNVIKYSCRANFKDSFERDIEKACFYNAELKEI